MLKTVIDAGLPIIAATTRDTINLADVLHEITGKQPVTYAPGTTKPVADTLYLFIMRRDDKPVDLSKLYSALIKLESTLIVVNPPRMEDYFFDAGEVPIPKKMLHDMLFTVTEDEQLTTDLVRALGGVTLKEAAELAKLTMARDQSLTAHGIVQTRKEYFQSQTGLFLVDPAQPLYIPDEKLAKWVQTEKSFFMQPPDTRLMPRGLLFDGPPGTGKTAGAKYIASEWGVPLYRFDVGSTKNKYVGESEGNMRANLARLDREEPCIVLFDEMEKVFADGEHGDSNTTTSMMSQVLWWLAEHQSRVLTIMTTNKKTKLPPELYREGRIDEVLDFQGLTMDEAPDFVMKVAKTFKANLGPQHIKQAVKEAFSGQEVNERISHALLTRATYGQVKKAILDN
ncbi:AAA-ATPase [Rhodobacter phage RcZahn]|nr:AAA-ATPase [Rhodobacter phage RcZahn]